MKIREYVQPNDVNEAYEKLVGRKRAVVMAGGIFLRLQKRTVPLVIDLSSLNIGDVKITGNRMTLGAMTTLRQIETDERLPLILRHAMVNIAGVAVRNMATVGGSIMGRYPFSDVATALLALNADLHFHSKGLVSLETFLMEGLEEEDLLLEITFDMPVASGYKAFKKTYTDFALVNVGLVKKERFEISIGARPFRAKRYVVTDLEDLDLVIDAFDFGTDQRASAAYRKVLARALLEDLREEVGAWK